MTEPERKRGEVIPDDIAEAILWEFPQPMFISNGEGRILYNNQAAAELLRTEPEDILGRHVSEFFSKENGGPIDREDVARVVDGQFQPLEKLILTRRDGKKLVIKCRKKRLTSFAGHELVVLGTIVETLEFAPSANDQETHLAQFLNIFEGAPEAIAVIDKEGKVLQVNTAAEKLTGFSRELIIGKTIYDFIVPASLEVLRQTFQNVFSGKANEKFFKFDIQSADGKVRQILVTPIRIKPEVIFCFAQDVTQEHLLQENITRTANLLENFFALADDGFFIAEADQPLTPEQLQAFDPGNVLALAEKFNIVKCNKSIAEQYQTSIEEMLGRTLGSFLKHRPQAMVDVVRELYQTGRAHYQLQLNRFTGEPFIAEGSLVFVRDSQGNIVQCIGVQRDMTQKITMQKELAEAEERLRLAHEVARLGTWEMDLSSQRIVRNSTWSEMLGYQPHEIELSPGFSRFFTFRRPAQG